MPRTNKIVILRSERAIRSYYDFIPNGLFENLRINHYSNDYKRTKKVT